MRKNLASLDDTSNDSKINSLMSTQSNSSGFTIEDPARATNYRELNTPFNHAQNAILFGISGGIVLGLYQLFVNGTDNGINIGIGLLGFFLLTPFLFFALRQFRRHLAGGEVFKNGIIHGLSISAIASIIMVVISTIGVTWQAAPQVINAEQIETGHLIVNGAFQILVGIVFGMTITFILLQGLKSDMRADKNIEKQHR